MNITSNVQNWLNIGLLSMLLKVSLIMACIHLPVKAQDDINRKNTIPGREKLLMDFGWRFTLGDACDTRRDFNHGTSYFSYWAKTGYGDGPAAPGFDDRGWRILDLPHDWAVELPFDRTGGHSHGYKAIGRNFSENSIGWYRKSFFIPGSDLGRKISLRFDGVFRNATVFVNGFYLGEEHSGYAGFQFDISDYLNYGSDNTVSVRVDATMEEGWFYEGAGIYRHVWLLKTDPLHVACNGTFVSSEIENRSARIKIRTTVRNENDARASLILHHSVTDAEGKEVASVSTRTLSIDALQERTFYSTVTVWDPELWSPDNPYLYSLQTTVASNGSVIDSYKTTYGIRSIHFDPEKGFFLNGKPLKLKGTNNHQDHAGVGTAIPDALQEYRIKKLKEMGSNAYRCSHNPPAPELLDACDRLGMLVIDENRLMGSNPEHLGLLEQLIKSDRNHPSVILWSLGNEEWTIEGNDYGIRIAETMQNMAHMIDSTRLCTIAGSGGWGHGVSTVVDVMGFNYIFNGDIDKQHTDFPDQPGVGTEETTSRSTRGIYVTDAVNGHLAQIDRTNPDRGIETGFNFYEERPFLAGLFWWTGFDYRGEPNPYGWPQVGSQSGILDQCGFPKDTYYYLQSWWTPKPVLYILPDWNQPFMTDQPVDVWVYSNCDDIELFLNNKSLGRKPVIKYSHLSWKVPYQPGELTAKGFSGGKLVAASRRITTGNPSVIRLTADRNTLKADAQDISVITVWAEDTKGNQVPYADNVITFSIEGQGRIIGVGNGDPSSHEADRYTERIDRIPVDNLKKKSINDMNDPYEVTPECDVTDWQQAFCTEGFESRIEQDTSTYLVIRGTFQLDSISDNTLVSLLAKSLCEDQSVYINGHLIASDVIREQAGQNYTLDRSILHPGENVYAVAGKPLLKRNPWEYLNTDPGQIRVIIPANPWKRKLFSGLAQVIIQSEEVAGFVRLIATSPGLDSATLVIETKSVRPVPALPSKYTY